MNLATYLLLLAGAVGQMDEEFQCGFGGGELHPALNSFGPDVSRAMNSDSGGLRITLAADRQDKAAVGVEPRFGISGDFEITLRYELVSVDTPSTGMGAGIKVWGKIDSDRFQAMTLAHMVPSEGSSKFSAIYTQEDRRRKSHFKTRKVDTKAKHGTLRLARTGSELAFAVAEGDGETFQELQRVQASTGEVLSLRASATTSGDPCGLSIRLIDLRIRAEDLPGKAVKLKRNGSSRWLVVWLVGIAAAGAGGFFLWRYRSAVWGLWPRRS